MPVINLVTPKLQLSMSFFSTNLSLLKENLTSCYETDYSTYLTIIEARDNFFTLLFKFPGRLMNIFQKGNIFFVSILIFNYYVCAIVNFLIKRN